MQGEIRTDVVILDISMNTINDNVNPAFQKIEEINLKVLTGN